MKSLNLTEITHLESIEINGGKAGDAAYLAGYASVFMTIGVLSPGLLGIAIARAIM
ncbi:MULTISPECIES: hypothetical protein [unclassified Sphingobacterium]|uniref:hypothetical protein n=1 Tax=unclassified Sphingobacterium TaxID=2609468 RepID=UPI0025E7B02D|nr:MULTISPECIES: hypothetical protein [unclassified Sphingobacterium]